MFGLSLVRRLMVLFFLAPIAFSFGVFSWAPHAQAQRVGVKAEFRVALTPHGEFRQHARWGEVWRPTRIQRNWKPYTIGRWVYSDDYGYYWEADQEEAEWGWVTYHYGRWVWDDDLEWCWVAGNEWSPGWVQWRNGDQYVGWAALPPDDIVAEAWESPTYWTFVEPRNLFAPRIAAVAIARVEPVFFRETVVVNRTVLIENRNFAVNPGIEPGFIAARIGRPVPTYEVRPRILAGTANIPGAIEIRPDARRRDVMRQQLFRENIVRQTSTVINPSGDVGRPRALGPRDRGVLGQNPPRMATGRGPLPQDQRGTRDRQQGTIGAAPNRQEQVGQPERDRAGRNIQERGKAGTIQQDQRGVGPRGQEQVGRPGSERDRNRAGRDVQERGKVGPTQQDQRGTIGAAPDRRDLNRQDSNRRDLNRQDLGRDTQRSRERDLQDRGKASTPQQDQRGTVGAAPDRRDVNRQDLNRQDQNRQDLNRQDLNRQDPGRDTQRSRERDLQDRGRQSGVPQRQDQQVTPNRERSAPSVRREEPGGRINRGNPPETTGTAPQRGREEQRSFTPRSQPQPQPQMRQSQPQMQQPQMQRGGEDRGTVGAGPPRQPPQQQISPSPQQRPSAPQPGGPPGQVRQHGDR